MLHGSYNVVTGELVTIGLYIGNASNFQVGFRLGEPESKHFVVASAVDRFKVFFYSVKVACVQNTVCVNGYTSRTRTDELGSHR